MKKILKKLKTITQILSKPKENKKIPRNVMIPLDEHDYHWLKHCVSQMLRHNPYVKNNEKLKTLQKNLNKPPNAEELSISDYNLLLSALNYKMEYRNKDNSKVIYPIYDKTLHNYICKTEVKPSKTERT